MTRTERTVKKVQPKEISNMDMAILFGVYSRLTNSQIAETLGIKYQTVKNHLKWMRDDGVDVPKRAKANKRSVEIRRQAAESTSSVMPKKRVSVGPLDSDQNKRIIEMINNGSTYREIAAKEDLEYLSIVHRVNRYRAGGIELKRPKKLRKESAPKETQKNTENGANGRHPVTVFDRQTTKEIREKAKLKIRLRSERNHNSDLEEVIEDVRIALKNPGLTASDIAEEYGISLREVIGIRRELIRSGIIKSDDIDNRRN